MRDTMHRMDAIATGPASPPIAPSGLSQAAAAQRLQEVGPNTLPERPGRTLWDIALEAVREPMLQLLVAAGLVYVVLGDVGEALMLLAFVAFTLGLSLYQEARTEKAVAALRELSSPHATVLRDGQRVRVPAATVVPGDVIVLGDGERVTADARLLQAHDLLIDESLLTGESVPVRKTAWVDAPPPSGAKAQPAPTASAAPRPGGDQQPWVFAGTMVLGGQGLAEVTATGPLSELGRIGRVLDEVQDLPSELQRQMRHLVRVFGASALALSVFVALLHWLLRGDPLAAVLSGITLAMSMLPQEFPLILTVFMAMAAWRMAQRRVLVRRNRALESLGAVTVLCTDKTGTLTVNRMAVAAIVTPSGSWRAHEGGAVPAPCVTLSEVALLASEPDPQDPMDKAIAAFERDVVKTSADAHKGWRLVHEYALTPQLLALSHVWEVPGQAAHTVAAKGAPEAVAGLCKMLDAALADVRLQAEAMAAQGMRVLGVARAWVQHGAVTDGTGGPDVWPAQQTDIAFEWVGLLGMQDPLREGVPQAVALCRGAGVRVLMVTGDHPATALALAAEAGLDVGQGVVRGDELQAWSDETLRHRLPQTQVFARVMPEQKLRLVQALQAHGEVVLMTGDGVNDAPSLKAAHIGVAMGGRGTDVAREASDMILLDDDFAAIPQALQLGRQMDDNLRKAMAFVLAVHVPIAGLSLLPLLVGWPLLFSPVHIAFLELLIDPVCAVVFEAEAAEPGLMLRPPRAKGQALLATSMLWRSLLQGVCVLILVGAVYGLALAYLPGAAQARAVAFSALVASNVALIFNNRALDAHLWASLKRPNRALWWLLAATVGLLALTLSVPMLRDLFQFAWPDWTALGGALGAGALTLLLLEAFKVATLPKRV